MDPKPLIEPITTRGLICRNSCFPKLNSQAWSSTPGPKFSRITSLFLSSSTNTVLPSADFMFTVIERLLQLSMVK